MRINRWAMFQYAFVKMHISVSLGAFYDYSIVEYGVGRTCYDKASDKFYHILFLNCIYINSNVTWILLKQQSDTWLVPGHK